MQRTMNEKKTIRRFQLLVLTASSLLVILFVAAWVKDGLTREWRSVQKEYEELLHEVVDSTVDRSGLTVEKGIRTYDIAELGRTDRCVTCHLGMENPFMENAPQPHRNHPGDYLQHHPVDQYGCTICHGGQGRALNKKEAFGQDPDTHWSRPLLDEPYLESSCGKCHLSIFGDGRAIAGTETFHRGKNLFNREGCLGCHKARGVGGIVGPDLTEQGEKTRHEYSFQNVQGEQTISNWLKEHFKDPEMVSPGSDMLKIDLPETDLDALTTFVMGLAKPDIAFDYFSLEALNEFKGNRHTLEGSRAFTMACTGCHGKEGQGKSYTEYKTGVPGIMNPDFLRLVSGDFIRFTLLRGRSQRQMASWMPGISGMKREEIEDLTRYLESQSDRMPRDTTSMADPGTPPVNTSTAPFDARAFRQASAASGNQLYRRHCLTCHGEEGRGGLALALNNPDLLAFADNEYLLETLRYGRGNTAMPSWETLTEKERYHLVAYMRSWHPYRPVTRNITFAGNNPAAGELTYHFRCSRCHGDFGQGETGPTIINRDFLEAASDTYLYNTVAYGRAHTAMFGWSRDVYNQERLNREEIGNIVAFMRTSAAARSDYIYAGANPGNQSTGEPLYKNHCAECHGTGGEGTEAPALHNQEFLNAASNGYLLGTITLGRSGTDMPAWGYEEEEEYPLLTIEERQHITAYIRSWQRIKIKL